MLNNVIQKIHAKLLWKKGAKNIGVQCIYFPLRWFWILDAYYQL